MFKSLFKTFLALLLVSIASREVHSANILIVGLTPSHSHHFWIEAVALGIVDQHHNVTFLSHDPTKVKRANYTVITLEGVYEKFDDTYESSWLQDYKFTPFTIPAFVDFFWNIVIDSCEADLHHATLHEQLLSYPKDFKFDLILWDHTMGHCLYPIIERFGNPPTIGLSPYGLTNEVELIYGGHVYPYVGQVNMEFTEATTIWQRLTNAMYINYQNYLRRTYLKPKIVELSRTVFKDFDADKFEHVEQNFNLALINWNVALNQPQALTPNLIPTGGIHIKTDTAIAKNIQDIYAKPSTGVIFFSLGSNTKSESLSGSILESFTQCFAELPDYQVIWKIKPPASLKFPPNVHAVSWAAQNAILAQAKTKLFITHGGGLSVHETTHFGVPIVGVPIFLDQTNNIEKLRSKGGGEIVQITEMNKSTRPKDVFCDKVKKVLNTASYTSNMKQLSKKYTQRQAQPLDTALYWVEYILKHGEAKHLSPMSRRMCAFYTQNLDIYLLFIACCVIPVGVIWAILKCCCGKRSINSKEKSA